MRRAPRSRRARERADLLAAFAVRRGRELPGAQGERERAAAQEELTTTENQISFSRQHYNATVLDFNNGIQTFPAALIAGPFGFHKREFFDAEPEADAVPTVDLSLS